MTSVAARHPLRNRAARGNLRLHHDPSAVRFSLDDVLPGRDLGGDANRGRDRLGPELRRPKRRAGGSVVPEHHTTRCPRGIVVRRDERRLANRSATAAQRAAVALRRNYSFDVDAGAVRLRSDRYADTKCSFFHTAAFNRSIRSGASGPNWALMSSTGFQPSRSAHLSKGCVRRKVVFWPLPKRSTQRVTLGLTAIKRLSAGRESHWNGGS